jgi:hypothetical protein
MLELLVHIFSFSIDHHTNLQDSGLRFHRTLYNLLVIKTYLHNYLFMLLIYKPLSGILINTCHLENISRLLTIDLINWYILIIYLARLIYINSKEKTIFHKVAQPSCIAFKQLLVSYKTYQAKYKIKRHPVE